MASESRQHTVAQLAAQPTFLMVGTIEPRKGHLQVLAAFELLWQRGVQANLVIVGNEGWRPLPENARRTIPEIVRRLESHPQRGQRLFWLKGIDDTYLQALYQRCDCLLAASEGEGFGLPLIEAAHASLPLIARDLPVFREVAGTHAHYFSGLEPAALADAVQQWLALDAAGDAPPSAGMPSTPSRRHARRRQRSAAQLALPLFRFMNKTMIKPSPATARLALQRVLLPLLLLVNLLLLVHYVLLDYRVVTNSDSAVMNLLAQEIHDTGQWIPRAWNYANGDLWLLFTHTIIVPLLYPGDRRAGAGRRLVDRPCRCCCPRA
eukprot:gene33098-40845_t